MKQIEKQEDRVSGFDIEWLGRGGPPQSPPNPNFPHGVDLDCSKGKAKSCLVMLPYPTGRKEIGGWKINCRTCGFSAYVTVASRPDDPKSIRLPCRSK